MQPNRQRPESVFNRQSQALFDFLNSERATAHIHQHQIEAVRTVHEQLSDPMNLNIALVVLPTRCGKTGVAVLASYVLNATKILVITPSVTISKQIYDAFCDKDNMFLLERQIITAEEKAFLLHRGVCIKNSTGVLDNLHFPLMIVNAHKIGGRSNVAIEAIPSDNYDLVIVDKAHHYPAPTWKLLVDNFPKSRRLFLTATPFYRGEYILPHPPCFQLTRDVAVRRNVIRPISFCEAEGTNPEEVIAQSIQFFLDEHDNLDPRHKHQAMVLTQTVNDLHSATDFVETYRRVCNPNDWCEMYTSESNNSDDILRRFLNSDIRVLVVVGKLLEGFDRKNVSVAGIVGNVACESKVLFTQFVGKAVHKLDQYDPVTTMVVSHKFYNQRENYDQFDKVTDYDNMD